MPRVSILLTSYNHAEHLRLALDSVWAQTFTDFELIALDDGSTDNSRAILESDPRIICSFSTSNVGTYACLNRGLALANGEFVAVLNDDDIWSPDKLRLQIELMDAHPEVGLCSTGGHFIDAQGRRLVGRPLGFDFPTVSTGDDSRALLKGNRIIASSALFRKALAGEFNEALFGSGDWEMWLRLSARARLGFVPGDHTLYRIHPGNASNRRDQVWKDDEVIRTWLRDRFDGWRELYETEKEFLENKAFNLNALGVVQILIGKKDAGRKSLREAQAIETTFKRKIWLLASHLPQAIFRKLVR